ncbi:arginase family protein [Actinoplanes sp. G11-F43]|uniref:arginase family protein n=1 Tax=Actinoplanes sp. G11-F43 TaxID=3424130 RepID=UPI003D3588EA
MTTAPWLRRLAIMSVGAGSIRLLKVPYDSGHLDVRMGAGPTALVRAGAARQLRDQGLHVRERLIEVASWRAEVRTAFELQKLVADEAAAAHAAGEVPMLLSGNCNTTVGMIAALTAPDRRVGVVWLDAHGDFNTPDTDASGFLDGHGLAMVVGRCWTALTSVIAGFQPVPEDRVVLVGARSLDSAEQSALQSSSVAWMPPDHARDLNDLRRTIEDLADRVDVVHVHVDLDVHDPSIAPANSYAAANGLSANEVQQVVRQVAIRIPVASATLASYDPAYDPHGRMARTALELLTLLARLAGRPGSDRLQGPDPGDR